MVLRSLTENMRFEAKLKMNVNQSYLIININNKENKKTVCRKQLLWKSKDPHIVKIVTGYFWYNHISISIDYLSYIGANVRESKLDTSLFIREWIQFVAYGSIIMSNLKITFFQHISSSNKWEKVDPASSLQCSK